MRSLHLPTVENLSMHTLLNESKIWMAISFLSIKPNLSMYSVRKPVISLLICYGMSLNQVGQRSHTKQNLNFNVDLAAKSGTTQGYGDFWLVGYNPNVSLGVWLGYKEQTRSLYYGLERQTLHPSTRTSLLFARLMNAANEVTPGIDRRGLEIPAA